MTRTWVPWPTHAGWWWASFRDQHHVDLLVHAEDCDGIFVVGMVHHGACRRGDYDVRGLWFTPLLETPPEAPRAGTMRDDGRGFR